MDCNGNCDESANAPGSSLAISENFSEKAGQDIDLVCSWATPQVASVLNTKMEAQSQRECFVEVEQMGDGNSISNERDENSGAGLAVCCVANESQEQGVVSDEVEQTQGSVSEAILLMNCSKQGDGKESQDTDFSSVPVVSGGGVLPVGVSEIDTKTTFVNDAPEQFEALETAKDVNHDEVGSDGFSCSFDGGGKEGRNELSSDQDAGLSDEISFLILKGEYPHILAMPRTPVNSHQ